MTRLLYASAFAALTVGLMSGGSALAQPSSMPADAAAPAPAMSLAAHGDIADTLKASGQFTILVKALDATNLTSVLKSAGPLTLFAPTDAAFQALPPGQLDDLMKPENAAQLQALLVYHLINAAAPPAKITGSKGPLRTAAGSDVQIDGSGGAIKVNNATVLADVAVTNGTVYVVNKVLMAPGAAAGGH